MSKEEKKKKIYIFPDTKCIDTELPDGTKFRQVILPQPTFMEEDSEMVTQSGLNHALDNFAEKNLPKYGKKKKKVIKKMRKKLSKHFDIEEVNSELNETN